MQTPESTTQRGFTLSLTTKTFIGLAAAHFLLDFFGGMWPVFKYLAKLDLERAGLIATVASIAGMATQPLFGYLADRGWRRAILVTGTALTFPGMLLGLVVLAWPAVGSANAYLLMFLIMLLVKLGQGMFHPAGAGLAGNLNPARRSLFVGMFVAVGGMGYGLSQGVFSWAYKTLGAHTEWLLIPGAIVLAWVIAWCRPTDRRSGDAGPGSTSADGGHFAGMMSARHHLFALFVILAFSDMLNTALQFILPEFAQLKGYPAWVSNGGAFFALVIGGVVATIPAGHLADRFGKRVTLIGAVVLAMVSFYAVVALPHMPTALFMVLCLAAGGCLGVANPLGVAFGQHLAPRTASTVSAVMMGLAWCVGSLAPLIVGALAKRPALGPAGALACVGVVGLATIALSFRLPRTAAQTGVPGMPRN